MEQVSDSSILFAIHVLSVSMQQQSSCEERVWPSISCVKKVVKLKVAAMYGKCSTRGRIEKLI